MLSYGWDDSVGIPSHGSDRQTASSSMRLYTNPLLGNNVITVAHPAAVTGHRARLTPHPWCAVHIGLIEGRRVYGCPMTYV